MTRAQLIALDWGTSNLRASLLGDGGQVLSTRSCASGVMAVPERRFAQALLELCAGWLAEQACPLVASGMIGSRQGWQEAPYLECPAGLASAALQLTRIDVQPGVVLHIVPGLRCIGRDGQHDVMRGEETQLWGAALPAGSCCVLPGTHSKWAWIGEGGTIDRFQTCMTGELYALLTQHGILGRLMVFGESSVTDFARGTRLGLAEHANLSHTIFAARTAGLMAHIAPAALPDFLSGILIGAEIGGTLQQHGVPQPIHLLGETALCERYARAFDIAGITTVNVADDATTRGQWQLALHAGLLEENP